MSVRLRLTLLYSSVLALTLLVFAIFLYFRTEHNQRAEVDRSLANAIDRVQNVGVSPSGNGGTGGGTGQGGPPPNGEGSRRNAVDVIRLSLTARLGDPQLLVQVDDPSGRPLLDASGQPLLQSPGLNDTTLPAPRTRDRHYEDVTVNHVPLRMLVTPVDFTQRFRPSGTPLSGQVLMLVARPLTDTDRTLDQLRFILIAGSLACLAAAGVAGWLLARNALRPIVRLTAEAHDIGRREDFKRRVHYRGPDDELGRLAATFNTMLDGLDAAHDRVRKALEAQRRFVADASHELRTPLTTIRGNVELLGLDGMSAEDEQEALADIASEAERMSRLVNNLLALARADAGFAIPRGPVDFAAVVAEAVQKARRLANGVRLELAGNTPATVQGDHDYLLQLLLILLDNALKFSPPDGRVTVTSSFDGRLVRTAVQDHGPGIPAEEQTRIFDRFYRADPSRHGEGTGLGLAIARWIAQELGGSIELASTSGPGCTFTVVLPGTPVPAAPAAADEEMALVTQS